MRNFYRQHKTTRERIDNLAQRLSRKAGRKVSSREVLEWFREDAVKNGSTINELIRATGFQLLERDRFQRLPKGMTIDEEYRDLLLQRHIMLVKRVGTKWFLGDNWLERTARTFKRCKPFIDYVNAIIDERKLGIKRVNDDNL